MTKLAENDSVRETLSASAEHRDLVTRAAWANAANASVLLSIPFNALFLTDLAQARLANGAAGQQRIAIALKDGLEKYLAGS